MNVENMKRIIARAIVEEKRKLAKAERKLKHEAAQ
jgi:hypothetical protein